MTTRTFRLPTCALLLSLLLAPPWLRAAPPAADEETLTRAQVLAAFQQVDIAPENGGYLFATGDFPKLRWDQPLVVREAWGRVLPLTVRWFDAGGREVTRAERPGRYAAFIEARAPDGPVIRRSRTFFAFDQVEMAKAMREKHSPPPVDGALASWFDSSTPAIRDAFREFAEEAVNQGVMSQEKGAILLAAAHEANGGRVEEAPLDHPLVRHQEHHLAVRRSVLGVQNAHPALQRPQLRTKPAPVLRPGTTAEAGFDDQLPQRLQALCETWLREGREPFTLVVARQGVIVFHQAYGEHEGRPVTEDTAYPLFSITKSLTGLMLALFLDQGLLDLNAPLGRVLTDFPTKGEGVITLRDCLMHTTGIEGQVAFGGLDNPWMDNVIANAWETHRQAYAYSGTACDLAGVAMQLVSGKSAPRLFYEHLFKPLEMKNARVTGLGMGGHLRAIDLARVGQLLLNKGAYGRHTFFSPVTYEQLLPSSYAELYPQLKAADKEYGLGIRFAGEPHPGAGKDGLAKDATILSPNTLGHGSFSGCIFRVDPERQIVIAMGRFGSGERHGEFLRELLMLISSGAR